MDSVPAGREGAGDLLAGAQPSRLPAERAFQALRRLWPPRAAPSSPLGHKPAFLLGGFAFSLVSYVAGAWIYSWELNQLDHRPVHGLWALVWRAPLDHPATFFPWLVATLVLAVLLGHLFDRQLRFSARLQALAATDGLTLLYNRRHLMRALDREVALVGRTPMVFSVLLVDLDDFKRYNDLHGHLAGDDALRLAAQTLRATARETDIVARYGGEEFVVVAPGADAHAACILAERVRTRFETALPFTASVGIATYGKNGSSATELLAAADGAMYEAKRAGKNTVRQA